MKAPPPLIVRADASPRIGTGHIMRCLALAQAWGEIGGKVVFLHAEITSALAARIVDAGFASEVFPVEPGSSADAEATAARAAALHASWIVGDGYPFDAAWQASVRSRGARLLLLDDYGHASHYHADIVLNQNAGASAALYERRDSGVRLLLGPSFALLRREFVEFPARLPVGSDRPVRVLVTMGGADPDDATGVIIEALAPVPGLEVLVVVGGANPRLGAIRARVAELGPAWDLACDVRDMPGLMAWADVAVSASGSTVWELSRAGLPAAIVVTADNQLGIAAALTDARAGLPLGRHPGLDPVQVRAALVPWLKNTDERAAMAARLGSWVDGRGARRVRAAMSTGLAISFLSDAGSWLEPWIERLAREFSDAGHRVVRVHEPESLPEGDLAFFLSLGRVVAPGLLRRHAHNLVVHESALPLGRGWSPLTWQILEGKNEIPVTLLEAADGVDSGVIYATRLLRFCGAELVHELRSAQAEATLDLCREFVARYPVVAAEGQAQTGSPTYYPRRRPVDSRLDPRRTIAEQFDLLRVCDPERYPAYFDHAGRRYAISVRALDPTGAPK